MNTSDEFYIGWEAKAAPRIARTVKWAVVILLLITSGAAVTLAISQRLVGTSVFEWGRTKTFSGVLQLEPYPHLLVPRPGRTASLPSFSSYYLVAPWKFGLRKEAIATLDAKPVTLKGTLIYRENQTMIEVQPNSIAELREADRRSPTLYRALSVIASNQTAFGSPDSAPVTLQGEIVDSKCFLGVMNPGRLTPHRACAVRCISGGIPPVLLVRAGDRPPMYFLLVSAAGKPVNQQVLGLVAEPVEITGRIQRQGDLMILRADPATYRRL